MQTIPGQVLKLRVLTEVPRSQYAEISAPKDASNEKERINFFRMLRRGSSTAPKSGVSRVTAQFLDLNAAGWLTFKQIPSVPVSLWLVFADDKGEHSVLVDEQRLSESHSVMLSGSVNIHAKGDIRYIKACVGGVRADDQLSVDELYVKRQVVEVKHQRMAG